MKTREMVGEGGRIVIMPTKKQIHRWLMDGKREKKYSYMILMQDIFTPDLVYPFYLRCGSEHREEIWTNGFAAFPLLRTSKVPILTRR